jgi:hypothetical protein
MAWPVRHLQAIQSMNFERLKEGFSKLGVHDLPEGAAALIGIVLLFLVFKTGKFIMKVGFFLAAVVFIGGACWWHFNK